MATTITLASLTAERRWLTKQIQYVNFGRVESLLIKDSQPFPGQPLLIVREIKFGGENGPRRELDLADFLLKQQVIELFAFFDEFRDGVIDVLEIKHGLPFCAIVREVLTKSLG